MVMMRALRSYRGGAPKLHHAGGWGRLREGSLEAFEFGREPFSSKGPLTRLFRVWSLSIHRLTTLIRKLGGTPEGDREGTEWSSYNVDNPCPEAGWGRQPGLGFRPSSTAILTGTSGFEPPSTLQREVTNTCT